VAYGLLHFSPPQLGEGVWIPGKPNKQKSWPPGQSVSLTVGGEPESSLLISKIR